jgi:hypothetical protein
MAVCDCCRKANLVDELLSLLVGNDGGVDEFVELLEEEADMEGMPSELVLIGLMGEAQEVMTATMTDVVDTILMRREA